MLREIFPRRAQDPRQWESRSWGLNNLIANVWHITYSRLTDRFQYDEMHLYTYLMQYAHRTRPLVWMCPALSQFRVSCQIVCSLIRANKRVLGYSNPSQLQSPILCYFYLSVMGEFIQARGHLRENWLPHDIPRALPLGKGHIYPRERPHVGHHFQFTWWSLQRQHSLGSELFTADMGLCYRLIPKS